MSLVSTALSSAFSLAGLPRSLALYGLALSAVGASFLTAAIFLALMTALGAAYASAIVGGAYLVVALMTLIVVRSGRP